ncbi:hypothetical protein JCM10212_003677 [Sporobolomyces blumeae]
MADDTRPPTRPLDSNPPPPLRIAFLGPLGTYSHQAATDFFGNGVELAPVERIADVFTAVATSNVPFGVVPIENSSFGPVVETQDELRTTRLCVRGMVQLKIGHSLLGRKGVPREGAGRTTVRRVYSHEQAIGQCRSYLGERYPQAEIIPVTSTAKAAQQAASEPEALAICSLKCAEVYNLDVIDTDIQDAGYSNTTRFVALSRIDTPLPAEYPLSRPFPSLPH